MTARILFAPVWFPMLALLATACAGCVQAHRVPDRATEPPAATHPNVVAARELDQEGVRNFREGRYAEAIRYFQAAHRLGGPSTELWNVARSRERLDDAEGAAGAIDEYLAAGGLSPQDRAEAERELRSLRARPSTLTVTTTPAGAATNVDGRTAQASTPVSLEVTAGWHTVEIRLDGYFAEKRTVEARFGHSIILSLDLMRARK